MQGRFLKEFLVVGNGRNGGVIFSYEKVYNYMGSCNDMKSWTKWYKKFKEKYGRQRKDSLVSVQRRYSGECSMVGRSI